MTQAESQSGESSGTTQREQVRAAVGSIQRRQWWLWSASVLVTLLLAVGVASFALPGLLKQGEAMYAIYLNQAVRGLVGLVLLFNIYSVYQQLQIHRIQSQLADQVSALSTVEERTEEVYKLAALDALTGLYNRRSGEQRLNEEIARCQRSRCILTILAIDVNGLKAVNDRLGHPAGDELLRQFSLRLSRAIRGSDVAIRMGGDEFIVLLPECAPEEVHIVLDRLGGLNVNLNGEMIPVEFASGWTSYVRGEAAEDLLKRADDALYADKRSGKEQPKPTPALP